MTRTKLTVRRTLYNDNNGNAVAEPGRGNKRITRQRNRHFKLKSFYPKPKRFRSKKRRAIRTMKVRRKSTYFSGKKTLRF